MARWTSILLALITLLCIAGLSESAPPTLSIAGLPLRLGMEKQEVLRRLSAKCEIVKVGNGVIASDKEGQNSGCHGDVVFFDKDVVTGVSRDEARDPDSYASALTLYKMLGENTAEPASLKASTLHLATGNVRNILVRLDDGREIVIQAVDGNSGNYMLLRNCIGTCLE